ncbi:M15 family metallopeptidase [Novipirellula galeiformis]|uniref:M15 family metallopeptidase n=1 Tax=Novipirellula galeiformis TaxID=2528004 RepID=UPI0018CF979B|nr:M15 family metallopeptidase [Novipirellula galeiformis]
MIPNLVMLVMFGSAASVTLAAEPAGTLDDPIIDSAMSVADAFDGLAVDCPEEIRERQKLVTVLYYSFDHKIHQGQVLIDSELEHDIQRVFAVALQEKFPIQSVIPISHPRFRKEGNWDDELSMQANNTSAFNYRVIAGTTRLSNHARGRAIDLNPLLNPYVRGESVSPAGAVYSPHTPGTLTDENSVTQAFLRLGWGWGGHWQRGQDYQHFDKP